MGLKILLVDDDHFVAEPTKLILEMVGHDVTLFSSPNEAINHFSLDTDVTLSTPTRPLRLSSILSITPSSISIGDAPG